VSYGPGFGQFSSGATPAARKPQRGGDRSNCTGHHVRFCRSRPESPPPLCHPLDQDAGAPAVAQGKSSPTPRRPFRRRSKLSPSNSKLNKIASSIRIVVAPRSMPGSQFPFFFPFFFARPPRPGRPGSKGSSTFTTCDQQQQTHRSHHYQQHRPGPSTAQPCFFLEQLRHAAPALRPSAHPGNTAAVVRAWTRSSSVRASSKRQPPGFKPARKTHVKKKKKPVGARFALPN